MAAAVMDSTGSDSGRESENESSRWTTEHATRTCNKVVITGGCGLLGTHVARSLYREWNNVEIVLFDETMATSETFHFITQGGPNGHFIRYNPSYKDILNKEHLRNAFRGATVVIHCSDRTEGYGWFQQRKIRQINIEGTRNIVEVSRECGVRVLVYCSTEGLLKSQDVTDRVGSISSSISSAYVWSKGRAEKLVLDANNSVNDGGVVLHTCSLHFPPLYGKYDTRLIPSAVRVARKFRGYYFLPSESYCSNAYVGNVAWGVVCAVQTLLNKTGRNIAGGTTYSITDTTPTSSEVFYKHFLSPFDCKVIAISPLTALVLKLVLSLVAMVIVLYATIFNAEVTPDNNSILHYNKLFTSASSPFSRKKSELELEYVPRHAFDTAKAASLKFYLSNYY